MHRILLPLVITSLTVFGCVSEVGELDAVEEAIVYRGVEVPVDPTMPDVDAIGYDIQLVADTSTKQESFSAKVEGTFVATRALENLELDFEGNQISNVWVDDRMVQTKRNGSSLVVPVGPKGGTPSRAKGSLFRVRVEYTGKFFQADGLDPNDFEKFGGLMAMHKNRAGRTIYDSLNWPSKARRWLPLRDHPRDGALVSWTITFPKQWTVVANGRHVETKDAGAGSRTWRYESLQSMPTYDFHLAAYDGWTETKENATQGTLVHGYAYSSDAPIAKKVYDDLPQALDYYAKEFGPYQWGKEIRFMEVPIFGGGMEHATVVSMDETLFDDPDSREVAFHELAHHWSGNLVRIRTWSDFWMSEGFTDYLTRRFIEQHDGAEAAKANWIQTRESAIRSERSNPHPLRPKAEVDVLSIFDATSYKKGAFVLRMLERGIGRQAFSQFLKGWFTRQSFKSIETKLFETELGASSTAARTFLERNRFFAQWVYGAGHPVLKKTMVRKDANTVELRIDQRTTAGAAPFTFDLEVDLLTRPSETGAEVRKRQVLKVEGATTTMTLRGDGVLRDIAIDPDVAAFVEIQ